MRKTIVTIITAVLVTVSTFAADYKDVRWTDLKPETVATMWTVKKHIQGEFTLTKVKVDPMDMVKAINNTKLNLYGVNGQQIHVTKANENGAFEFILLNYENGSIVNAGAYRVCRSATFNGVNK